jgi:hypothetical protein
MQYIDSNIVLSKDNQNLLDKKNTMDVAEKGLKDVGGGALSLQPSLGGGPPLRRTDIHVFDCACGACHRNRVANGTQDAYMARLKAETDSVLAKYKDRSVQNTPNSKPMNDLEVIKGLFKSVQGVNFDDKCPHGIPFYTCMSCSH